MTQDYYSPTATPAAPADNDAINYDAFLNQLIVQLGFDKLPPEQRQPLEGALRHRIEVRVLRVMMDSLTSEQAEKAKEIIATANDNGETLTKYLVENAPNVNVKVLQALDDLYQEMKAETDMAWGAAAAKADDTAQ